MALNKEIFEKAKDYLFEKERMYPSQAGQFLMMLPTDQKHALAFLSDIKRIDGGLLNQYVSLSNKVIYHFDVEKLTLKECISKFGFIIQNAEKGAMEAVKIGLASYELNHLAEIINSQTKLEQNGFKITKEIILSYLWINNKIRPTEGNKQYLFEPTEEGTKIGIEIRRYVGNGGYIDIGLNKNACNFIYNNIRDIFYQFYGSSPFSFAFIAPYKDFCSGTGLTKTTPVITETKKPVEVKISLSNKTLFVFDFDGTVFNTDHLRFKRKNRQVTENDIKNVDYIEGFKELFLNKDSRLYLGKFKVLGITSSYDFYYQTMLNTHQDFLKLLSYKTIKTSEKIKELKAFMIKHKNEFDDVIAFGDDEKDALIYSKLGIKFYIVNNYYGYDPEADKILEQAKKNKENCFRKNYLHDVKIVGQTGYKINYFDDVVLYYKNYLKTLRFDMVEMRDKGSDYAPSVGGVAPLRVFEAKNEMGKHSKNDYILNHLDQLASLFDDLPLDKNSVLAILALSACCHFLFCLLFYSLLINGIRSK